MHLCGALFSHEPASNSGDLMRLMTRVVMTSIALGFALPVQAQSTTITSPVAADTSSGTRTTALSAIDVAAPTVDTSQHATADRRTPDLRVAAHYAVSRQSAAPAMIARQRAGLGQPMAMMVVGGAALLAGAIIGDTPGTIIMIGGAVIGLIGLYEYLQ
jgi:hypothetical protein